MNPIRSALAAIASISCVLAGCDSPSPSPLVSGRSDQALLSVCGPFFDDVPNIGRGPDGNYGDGKKGPTAAVEDEAGLLVDPDRVGTLARIDAGTLTPDPESRLGAYASTRGFAQGTAGYAVHNAIGSLYESLGTYGEEKVGRVFVAPEITVFYTEPVDSPAGHRLADIEYRYWQNVACEDVFSAGGRLGSSFSPSVRDWLQRYVFSY